MRKYILTETERTLLDRYLETGVKTSHTLVVLHRIRKNYPQLMEDFNLIAKVMGDEK